jgi:hypothetical protein
MVLFILIVFRVTHTSLESASDLAASRIDSGSLLKGLAILRAIFGHDFTPTANDWAGMRGFRVLLYQEIFAAWDLL